MDEEPKKKFYKQWWFWVLVVIFVIIIINAAGGGHNGGATTSDNSSATQAPQGICNIDANTLAKQAEKIDYKQLNKEPDSFMGKVATFTGQILQIQQSGSEGILRLSVTNEGYGIWSPNDVIYVTYHQPTKSVEDDIVTITGKLTGSETYTSQANYQITVPSMDVCSIGSQTAKTNSSTTQTKQPSGSPVVTTQTTSVTAPPATINCSTDSQCGTSSLTGSPSCQGSAVYQSYITYTCNKAGTPQSYCSNSTTQQLQQTCSSSQTCSNGTCNTSATWHTAFSYSDTSGNNTTSFSLRGSQSRITYSCTTSDSSLNAGWFNGIIEATDPSQPYPQSDNFATTVDCPINKTFNEYSLPSGQYYLHLDSWNSSYTVTVEDYY